MWAFALTVDEEHGTVYEPVSGPGANLPAAEIGPAPTCLATLLSLSTSTQEN